MRRRFCQRRSAVRAVQHLDCGWMWEVQLPEAPEFYCVGVSFCELDAHRDARRAISALRDSPRYRRFLHDA